MRLAGCTKESVASPAPSVVARRVREPPFGNVTCAATVAGRLVWTVKSCRLPGLTCCCCRLTVSVSGTSVAVGVGEGVGVLVGRGVLVAGGGGFVGVAVGGAEPVTISGRVNDPSPTKPRVDWPLCDCDVPRPFDFRKEIVSATERGGLWVKTLIKALPVIAASVPVLLPSQEMKVETPLE